MKTKINLKILEEKKACQDGIEWFDNNFGDQDIEIEKVIEKLKEQRDPKRYIPWLFDNFKLSGVWKKLNSDGVLVLEENYKDGKWHGISRGWNRKGVLIWEANYKDGEWHGLRREWNDDGVLIWEANYENDKLNGVRREWNDKGVLVWGGNYRNGKLVSRRFNNNNKKNGKTN